jgi:hypothetical protein
MCDDQYWPVYELYDLSIKYSLFIVIIFEIYILIGKALPQFLCISLCVVVIVYLYLCICGHCIDF